MPNRQLGTGTLVHYLQVFPSRQYGTHFSLTSRDVGNPTLFNVSTISYKKDVEEWDSERSWYFENENVLTYVQVPAAVSGGPGHEPQEAQLPPLRRQGPASRRSSHAVQGWQSPVT